MEPKIEINYLSKSDDPNRHCDRCTNFVPHGGDSDDGDCFGYTVSAGGLCNLYCAKPEFDTERVTGAALDSRME